MGGEAGGLNLLGVLHGPALPSKAAHHLTSHGDHIGHHSPADGEEEVHDVALTVVATGLVRMEEVVLLVHGEKQPEEDLDPLATAVEAPSRDGRRVTRVDGQVQSAHFETGRQAEEQLSLCSDPPVPSNPV